MAGSHYTNVNERGRNDLQARCARDGSFASQIKLIKLIMKCWGEPEGFGHRWCVKSHNVLAEFEQYFLKDEHGPSAAQDGERLPSKQGIGYPSQRGSKQRLNGTLTGQKRRSVNFYIVPLLLNAEVSRTGRTYDAALRRLAQQSAEGDDGGHAGTVEEEERGHTLKAAGVSVVRQVMG